MEWLTVTAQLYQRVYVRGVLLAARNWPVLFTVLIYSTRFFLASAPRSWRRSA